MTRLRDSDGDIWPGHRDRRDARGGVMRTFRTVRYWVRRVLRPSSVLWTLHDNDAWEWTCWTEDA